MIATAILVACLVIWNLFAPEAELSEKVEVFFAVAFNICFFTDGLLFFKKMVE